MTKEELEVSKLELELKQLKKPWWKKFDSWKSIVTVILTSVIALFSILYAWKTGLLDFKSSKLEIDAAVLTLKKEHLISEIDGFNNKKQKIEDSIKNLGDSLRLIKLNLNEKTTKLISFTTILKGEKIKTKNLEIEKIYNLFRYYDPFEKEKLASCENLVNSLTKTSSYGVRRVVYAKYNMPMIQNIKYDFEELFPKVRYFKLDKVAQIYKMQRTIDDTLFIKFDITDTLLLPYTSPIIVYIKNANKIIYSGIFASKRIKDKIRCAKCKEEVVAINIKGFQPMKYELTYGLFHQGSLREKYLPCFFFNKEQIYIKEQNANK